MKNRHSYPAEWHSNIRPAVLNRDGFKCVDCKIKQRAFGYYNPPGVWIECDKFMADWAIKNGFKPWLVFLQVSHENGNPSDCRMENLKARCPRCHLKFDKQRNLLIRKGFKAL